jgi:Flp pilus assembly protein TadD/ketosteroid isomerase-like protein
MRALLLAFALGCCANAVADELKEISQLINQGQHGQALDRINAYLASHPQDVEGLFLKGVIFAEQKKSAEAIKIFSTITERHPELPEPYNNLAVLYAEQGQYDKARQALEKAIRTHPSYATAHENLGDIYAKMASDAYDKALQLDRANTRAQTKLAMVKELFTGNGMIPPKLEEAPKNAAASPSIPDMAKSMEDKAKAAAPLENKAKPVDKPAAAEMSKAESQQVVMDAVHRWAKAWSAKDIDAYLASYADDFKTPNGESLAEWQGMRKQRIRKPAPIQVEVLHPKVSVMGNHATVSFKQSYRSGSNTMRTDKTLYLRKDGERWLITQEITDR